MTNQVAAAKVNLAEKLGSFSDHWAPRIVARYNDNEVRVVKVDGEFIWHQHDEDEGELGRGRGSRWKCQLEHPGDEAAVVRASQNRKQRHEESKRDALQQPGTDHEKNREGGSSAAERNQILGEPEDLALGHLISMHSNSLAALFFRVTPDGRFVPKRDKFRLIFYYSFWRTSAIGLASMRNSSARLIQGGNYGPL